MAVVGADAGAAVPVADVGVGTLLPFLTVCPEEAGDAEAGRFCPVVGAKEIVLWVSRVTFAVDAAVFSVEALGTGTEDAGGGFAAFDGMADVEQLGVVLSGLGCRGGEIDASWLIG